MRSREACLRWVALLSLIAFATHAWAASAAPSTLRRLVFTTLVIELALAIVALGIAAIATPSPAAALGLERAPASRWRLAVAALGTVGLSALLDAGLVRSGLRDASVLAGVDALLADATPPDLALALIGLVAAPAFAEELFCRGLLQRGLARQLRPSIAVLAASVCFGALHLEWIQGAAAALLGLYLGAVARQFDSTGASMLCHLANNAVAVLSAAHALPIDGTHPVTLLLGGLLAVAGIFTLSRVPRRLESDADRSGATSPVVSPLQSEPRSDDS
jgi:membrane protease YdiL (CAAX protease family)